ESYAAHRLAYQRIFDRLGLSYTVVVALPGPRGGYRGEEFLAEAPAGDDPFVACTTCGYAASTEAVTTPPPPEPDSTATAPMRVHDTPDTPTIEALVAYANQHALGGRRDWTAA